MCRTADILCIPTRYRRILPTPTVKDNESKSRKKFQNPYRACKIMVSDTGICDHGHWLPNRPAQAGLGLHTQLLAPPAPGLPVAVQSHCMLIGNGYKHTRGYLLIHSPV
ncbi:hypothetical protein J6590_001159 [Homalodisca vitripennis]|nr:hypothetical protein J6590_001159 [Homalodisca vitripennis]